jgi:hypothetical protein
MKNSSFRSKRRREAMAMADNPIAKGRLLNRAEFQHKVADTRGRYSRKRLTVILLPDDPPRRIAARMASRAFANPETPSYIKRKET